MQNPPTSNFDTPPDLSPTDSNIPLEVWFLGFMMLFLNIASTMVYSLSGVYLKNILGVSTGWIGFLDGVAEGSSYAAKLFSGIISDFFRRRKLIVVLGCTMALISRPLIASFPSRNAVFAARFLERLGNGVQATPRDALVSDVAPKSKKGASFGLMRSIGIVGSFSGGFLGYYLMSLTLNNYQFVFWLATIPSIIGLALLLIAIKEPQSNLHPPDHQKRHPIHLSDIPRLGRAYWLLMFIVAVFMLSRVSETLLILHAHSNFGMAETNAPLVLVLYNITYSLAAYPVGKISDTVGRQGLLALSIVVLIMADLLLWQASSLLVVLAGVAMWGLQMGMSLSIFMALIADLAPKDLRGTAFGFFHLINAVALVFAGIWAGIVTDVYGEPMVFLTSGIIGIIALLLVLLKTPARKESLITV